MTDARPHDDWLERVLDLALYAPVGAALSLREGLPKHVKQGRQAMENRVQLARFIGQLTVQTGQRELRKRLEERRAGSGSAHQSEPPAESSVAGAPPEVTPPESHGPGAAETVAPFGHPSSAGADTAVPTADDLPITDYESVPAINVVERLRTMRPDEIELIRRFEAAHRGRRTILAKIDQLQQRQHDAGEHDADQRGAARSPGAGW